MSTIVAETYLEAIKDIDFSKHMAAYEASMMMGGRSSSEEENRGYEVDQNGVAHFKVEGPITKKMSSMSSMFGGTSSIQLARAFDRAGMDPTVKGASAIFDTPGGAISGLTTAEAAMQRFRKKKPLVGYIDGLCASAGYWLASQCDALYGDASAIAGHIGVYQALTDTSERMQKEGVKRIVVKSSEGKGAGTPGTPITDDQIADVKREVDIFHAMFEGAIAKGRNMKPEKVSAISDGRGYIGEEAVKLGLMDGIKDQSGAYKALLRLIEDRGNKPAKEKNGMAGEEETKTEEMGFKARLIAWLQGDGSTATVATSAELIAERAETARLKALLANQAEDDVKNAKRRNDEIMEAYAKEGKFTAANATAESELRASNPIAYDALWKSRPVLPDFGGKAPPVQNTTSAEDVANVLLSVTPGKTKVDDMIMEKVLASIEADAKKASTK